MISCQKIGAWTRMSPSKKSMTRSCNIIYSTFTLQQGGNTRHVRDFRRRERLHKVWNCEGCWDYPDMWGIFCEDKSVCIKCGTAKVSEMVLLWSRMWLCFFFLEIDAGIDSFVTGMVTFCFNERTTTVGRVLSEWLSVNHARDYTLTTVCMWNMPSTIDNVKLQATSDSLIVAFASWLEFRMSSCGYIRRSIFANTISAWFMDMSHLTQKTFALNGRPRKKILKYFDNWYSFTDTGVTSVNMSTPVVLCVLCRIHDQRHRQVPSKRNPTLLFSQRTEKKCPIH